MKYRPFPRMVKKTLYLKLDDPRIPTIILESARFLGADHIDAVVVDGKVQCLFPPGAFGESMDMSKLKYKVPNARQNISDLTMYGKGLFPKDVEDELYNLWVQLDKLDSKIVSILNEKGLV